MKFIDEVLPIIADTLLVELISERAEKLEYLPVILQDINYLEDKEAVIASATECEMFDTQELEMIEVAQEENAVRVAYEMPCILSVWKDEIQLLRITTAVTGVCVISGISEVAWDEIDFESMDHNELLGYKGLVDMKELSFVQTECDDVRPYN